MELTADCSRCFALCCAALPFSASSDFAQAKPAGVPCSNLADDFGCSIHQRLASTGWRGCTVYDCAGAGQQVAQGSYAGVSWRERPRSEEHTSELQSLMRISYAVFCLKKKT